MLVVTASFVFLAYLIVQLIFFSKSKTMGKAALGMQVISSKNGKPIGFWMMLLREWIVKSASSRVFMLGYFWVLIDEQNRGWHDKILDTYVVDLKESEMLSKPTKVQQESATEMISEPEDETPTLPITTVNKETEEFVEAKENDNTEKTNEKDM